MKQEEMAEFMDRIYKDEICAVRKEGQAEYAGEGNDAFANFQRIGDDLNMDPKKILWVYAMKHRDGIANYLNGHTSQREDVTGRIKDLITYLFLLWGMIDEEQDAAQGTIKWVDADGALQLQPGSLSVTGL